MEWVVRGRICYAICSLTVVPDIQLAEGTLEEIKGPGKCVYYYCSSSTSGKNQMEITEVKIYPASEGRLRAYVSIVFDNCFIIRELKLVEGDSGLFVSMPSRRKRDGSFKDIAHPLNSKTRTLVEQKVITEYNRLHDTECEE